jgi:hypothetical protein
LINVRVTGPGYFMSQARAQAGTAEAAWTAVGDVMVIG